MACPTTGIDYTVLPGVDPCTAKAWHQKGQELGLTEFDPTTVNWNDPIGWGNDPEHCSMSNDSGCLIPLGVGFGIVLGFGLFFTVFTTFLVWMEGRFSGTTMDSETFNTGGRDVRT